MIYKVMGIRGAPKNDKRDLREGFLLKKAQFCRNTLCIAKNCTAFQRETSRKDPRAVFRRSPNIKKQTPEKGVCVFERYRPLLIDVRGTTVTLSGRLVCGH